MKIPETMTQNLRNILRYTEAQIEIKKKKKKSIVQIHKINQNKRRFLFWKFSGVSSTFKCLYNDLFSQLC